MSPVGRLFFEIGGDTSRLNASIKEAIKTAEEAGVKITRAGQSFVASSGKCCWLSSAITEHLNILGLPAPHLSSNMYENQKRFVSLLSQS
jgi:hypothetical protein